MSGAARRRITLGARVMLGGVLFVAGVLKAGAAWSLAEDIANYRMLPASASQLFAVVLPWLEMTVGLLLLANLWVRASAALAGALLSAFAVAAVTAVVRGLDISCGCFGTGSAAPLGLRTIAVDLILAAVSIWVWRGESAPDLLDTPDAIAT